MNNFFPILEGRRRDILKLSQYICNVQKNNEREKVWKLSSYYTVLDKEIIEIIEIY